MHDLAIYNEHSNNENKKRIQFGGAAVNTHADG